MGDSQLGTAKKAANRRYRSAVDHCLVKRHRTTDYFSSSFAQHQSIDQLERIVLLATNLNVQLKAHPLLSIETDLLVVTII